MGRTPLLPTTLFSFPFFGMMLVRILSFTVFPPLGAICMLISLSLAEMVEGTSTRGAELITPASQLSRTPPQTVAVLNRGFNTPLSSSCPSFFCCFLSRIFIKNSPPFLAPSTVEVCDGRGRCFFLENGREVSTAPPFYFFHPMRSPPSPFLPLYH